MSKPRERIPYQEWSVSQLSVAKYYGAITINGHHYVLDYKNCETKGKGEDIRYFPDLVLVKNKPKNTNATTR